MMHRQLLETLGYTISDRRFSDIADIVAGSADYSRFRFKAEVNKNELRSINNRGH